MICCKAPSRASQISTSDRRDGKERDFTFERDELNEAMPMGARRVGRRSMRRVIPTAFDARLLCRNRVIDFDACLRRHFIYSAISRQGRRSTRSGAR
jgi:hypothetical protein